VLERQAKEEELIRMQKIRDAAERAEAVEREKKAAAKQSKEQYRLQLEQQVGFRISFTSQYMHNH
jgi:hypothetical protein